ncbi:MAG: alpha-galactosidase [Actinobacteria bacterium]|nr:alpha-galactosidase [Actinomycetota bacterium]MCG2818549.1 alpha-galactosidase [Actinomycetes bacterium]MBU4218262.1 alpha-galactosidase [Actinomycetota bacterium]MBU4358687.1 alpha-galactosidase [Actinomycetota bacterium]MBU4391998.1 alpha-galactosidase [Actinomycetota bacterium]
MTRKRVPVYGDERCGLEFDTRTGTFSISSGPEKIFGGATGRVLVRKKKGLEQLGTPGEWEEDGGGEGLAFFKREEWGRLLFRARREGGALVLQVGLVWEAEAEPPCIDSMAPLAVPPGGVWPGRASNRPWRFYRNGWQCWVPSGTLGRNRPGGYMFPLFLPRRLKAMIANPTTPVFSEKGRFASEWFGALGDLDKGDSVAVGFVSVTRALSQVKVRLGRGHEEAEIEAAARFEGKRPERGVEFMSEPLAVIPGDLSGENLEAYAGMVAREQGVGEVRGTPPGWCSWYQYFTGVTAEDVKGNLRLMSGRYRELGIEVVQVDDGYQEQVGDWLEANEKFPGGLEETAREISEGGKTPGIWVAPFTVTRRSRVFREKKEWLLKNRRGRPVLAGVNPSWRGRFYGLDLSHPDVLQWLHDVFTTLAGYGYRFIKLDFMATGLLAGERHDPSLTRAEAARRALRVIREAVGNETYLIAAGGPILLGAGILDAQRVGPDVAPRWSTFWQPLLRDRSSPGLRNCLQNVFTRSFLSGRLFEGDPDCLLLRGSGTRLGKAERQTLASAAAVFGGSVMFSDDAGLWGPEDVEMAARVLPPVKARPRCPDLWQREAPMFLVSRLEDPGGEYHLAWILNWSGRRRDIRVRIPELGIGPGRYHACEFWNARYLGLVEDSFLLEGVPGHGSAVVRLTPEGDEPRLVGSNIHISQGAAELVGMRRDAGGVSVKLETPIESDAVIHVALPGEGEVAARLNGDTGVSARRASEQVFRLEFKLDRSGEIEISRVDGYLLERGE